MDMPKKITLKANLLGKWIKIFVTMQIFKLINLGTIGLIAPKLIPHAKITIKNVSPSCYDI